MRVLSILILSLILGLSLSGCGFHLRGTLLPFDAVTITPDDPFDPFIKKLRISLKNRDIKTNTNLNSKNAKLHILSHDIIEQPIAYGPDGELRREKLILVMHYEYTPKNSEKTFNGSAKTQRYRQLNADQILADDDEKILLTNEMYQDIINLLFMQLSKWDDIYAYYLRES